MNQIILSILLTLNSITLFSQVIADSLKIAGHTICNGLNTPFSALIEVTDLESTKTISSIYSDSLTGYYQIKIPIFDSIQVICGSQNHFLHVEILNRNRMKISSSGIAYHDIYINPIIQHINITLENLYFKMNKYTISNNCINSDYKTALKKIISLMEFYPLLRIEICGNTSFDEIDMSPYKLSMLRANAVYEYLIKHGIKANRLAKKGWGNKRPIGNWNNDFLNRNVQFVIIYADRNVHHKH